MKTLTMAKSVILLVLLILASGCIAAQWFYAVAIEKPPEQDKSLQVLTGPDFLEGKLLFRDETFKLAVTCAAAAGDWDAQSGLEIYLAGETGLILFTDEGTAIRSVDFTRQKWHESGSLYRCDILDSDNDGVPELLYRSAFGGAWFLIGADGTLRWTSHHLADYKYYYMTGAHGNVLGDAGPASEKGVLKKVLLFCGLFC
ncbi:MAG: hypothetical protein HY706_14345 [Candidatus Hydrogenedentes bacterium]|nr:hypothetical protein [Candidatus Hydrogenedentota bacterium]